LTNPLTIYYIQELCHSTKEEFYVLYTHSKGATRPDSEIDKNWRHYLQYWTQEKWRECVQHLDEGYDICGPSLILPNTHHYHNNIEPFYAGNTWWARSSYLRTCIRLLSPPERNYKCFFPTSKHHRFDMESWSGSGMPTKAYNMTKGARYNCWVEPPETYR
jgi:hypothetical protein